jgi:phenylacetate-CoA ligase
MPWYERLYARLPVSLQHCAISLAGLQWRHERLSGGFSGYVDDFRSRDHLEPAKFQSYVEGELRRVLTRAFTSVPYYRDLWRAFGVTLGDIQGFTVADLQKLPATPKQALRDAPSSFLDVSPMRANRTRTYYSSGSTGTPVTAVCSVEGHRKFIAAREARSFGWAGVSLRMPRATIGGRYVVPPGPSEGPYYRYNLPERQLYFSAYHLNEGTVARYVDALNKWQPPVFTGYAYSHFALAQLMQERGLALDYAPRALIMSSENLTLEMKSTIAKSFHARAFEEYGSIENVVLSTECEAGHLHMHPDFGIAEIVDEANRPVPARTVGKILGTSLLNDVQLLIRYEVGDLAVWDDVPCPCGRNHLPTVKEIVGRLEDAITTRDGRSIVRLDKVFNDLENIVEGQIVQETAERIKVNVVTRTELADIEKATLSARLRERVGEVDVAFERLASIPRTERGKFRAVVSMIRSSSGDSRQFRQ